MAQDKPFLNVGAVYAGIENKTGVALEGENWFHVAKRFFKTGVAFIISVNVVPFLPKDYQAFGGAIVAFLMAFDVFAQQHGWY